MLVKLIALILAGTATKYPAGSAPETEDQRIERWTMIAEVIHKTAQEGHSRLSPRQSMSFVTTVFRYESALDYHVHGGEKSVIGHQDHGTVKCMGQIKQNSMDEDEWKALVGRDRAATKRCVVRVLEHAEYHLRRCRIRKLRKGLQYQHNDMATVLTAYATGTTCLVSQKGSKRAVTWAWLSGKLKS